MSRRHMTSGETTRTVQRFALGTESGMTRIVHRNAATSVRETQVQNGSFCGFWGRVLMVSQYYPLTMVAPFLNSLTSIYIQSPWRTGKDFCLSNLGPSYHGMKRKQDRTQSIIHICTCFFSPHWLFMVQREIWIHWTHFQHAFRTNFHRNHFS